MSLFPENGAFVIAKVVCCELQQYFYTAQCVCLLELRLYIKSTFSYSFPYIPVFHRVSNFDGF